MLEIGAEDLEHAADDHLEVGAVEVGRNHVLEDRRGSSLGEGGEVLIQELPVRNCPGLRRAREPADHPLARVRPGGIVGAWLGEERPAGRTFDYRH